MKPHNRIVFRHLMQRMLKSTYRSPFKSQADRIIYRINKSLQQNHASDASILKSAPGILQYFKVAVCGKDKRILLQTFSNSAAVITRSHLQLPSTESPVAAEFQEPGLSMVTAALSNLTLSVHLGNETFTETNVCAKKERKTKE